MITKVDIPVGKKGEWTIDKFTTEFFHFGYALAGRPVPKGETYTRLCRGSTLVMSDTPAEQKDHEGFYNRAAGEVLIAGLGIGMILEAVAKKPEVKRVTVVEVSQDLIDLVWPTYQARYGDKIQIVCADINSWRPASGHRYDCAWFDIWDNISPDNLPEMARLHRRFSRSAAWRGSWAKTLCQRMNREEKADEHIRKILRALSGEDAQKELAERFEKLKKHGGLKL